MGTRTVVGRGDLSGFLPCLYRVAEERRRARSRASVYIWFDAVEWEYRWGELARYAELCSGEPGRYAMVAEYSETLLEWATGDEQWRLGDWLREGRVLALVAYVGCQRREV